MSKTKLYPSALSWCVDGQNITSKERACWRYQQLADGVKTPFPKLLADMGALNEQLYADHLRAEGEEFQEEVPFKLPIGDDAVISGRCDFLMDDRVDELKSSLSKHAKAKWSKGTFDMNHLAQHCLYISHFGKEGGYLVYAKFQENNDGDMVKTYGKRFRVLVHDDGHIAVDGALLAVTMSNLTEYIAEAVKHKQSDRLAPAPMLDDPTDYRSPCRYCPLAPLCETATTGDLVAPLKDEARALLLKPSEREPKLTRTRLKKFQRSSK